MAPATHPYVRWFCTSCSDEQGGHLYRRYTHLQRCEQGPTPPWDRSVWEVIVNRDGSSAGIRHIVWPNRDDSVVGLGRPEPRVLLGAALVVTPTGAAAISAGNMGGAFVTNAATLRDTGCRKWGWNHLMFTAPAADEGSSAGSEVFVLLNGSIDASLRRSAPGRQWRWAGRALPYRPYPPRRRWWSRRPPWDAPVQEDES